MEIEECTWRYCLPRCDEWYCGIGNKYAICSGDCPLVTISNSLEKIAKALLKRDKED